MRTKKTVLQGVTREAAEQAFAEFAKADAQYQQLTARMDLEVTRIREKYADQLAGLADAKERSFDLMQAYATEHRDELFAKRKSIESTHGVFGFRTGKPQAEKPEGLHLGSRHQPGQGTAAPVHPHHRRAGQAVATGRPRQGRRGRNDAPDRRTGSTGRNLLRRTQERE